MTNTATNAGTRLSADRAQRATGLRIGAYSLRPDWAHLAFVTAVAGWIVWYYFDALAASPNIQNMLLIRPVTVVALVIYTVIIIQSLRIRPVAAPVEPGAEPLEQKLRGAGLKGLTVAILLCSYVALLPYLGFDVATFLFVGLSMMVAGERRVWMLIVYPAVFAVGMAACFRFALSTPVPTMLF